MLRRVNAGLFEAPPGARIRLVAAAQGNIGVEQARYQYGTEVLAPMTIDGLPGCEFVVGGDSDLLEVGVVFHPLAPGSARYDLFEFENGVRNSLDLFVRNSDSSPLIFFTIDPVGVLAGAGATRGRGPSPGAAPREAPETPPPPPPPPPPPVVKRAAKKRAAKKVAPKKAARKARPAKKRAPKKAARKARPAKKAAPRRKASKRAAPRKRAK
jgi:hypothetical protein